MRGADPLAATVAGGAVLAFVYWVVHGMTDWFWEWAGLGAPAFALLGLACALAPRRAGETEGDAAPAAHARRPAASSSSPAPRSSSARWPSPARGRPSATSSAAGAVFAQRPFESYSRLDRAADLDPAQRPAGADRGLDRAALRRPGAGEGRRSSEALDRNPRGQYATLELGAIASVQGDRARALALLRRAVALAPRDAAPRRRRSQVVEGGGTVDIAALNRRILSAGQRITQG